MLAESHEATLASTPPSTHTIAYSPSEPNTPLENTLGWISERLIRLQVTQQNTLSQLEMLRGRQLRLREQQLEALLALLGGAAARSLAVRLHALCGQVANHLWKSWL